MAWNVEVSDEFAEWFQALTSPQRVKITASVELLERHGPKLDHPHSSKIIGSRFGVMRELRVQIAGEPWRVFYAFDPRRVAYLIVGGCKQGDARFYERMVRLADAIYEQHLQEL